MTSTMIPAAQPIVGDDERAAVDRVMRSGMLAQGPEVAAFETEFAEVVDGRHCVALNSGTSALHMAFVAAGIGPGLLRLSIGIEDVEDLLADLERGLRASAVRPLLLAEAS